MPGKLDRGAPRPFQVRAPTRPVSRAPCHWPLGVAPAPCEWNDLAGARCTWQLPARRGFQRGLAPVTWRGAGLAAGGPSAGAATGSTCLTMNTMSTGRCRSRQRGSRWLPARPAASSSTGAVCLLAASDSLCMRGASPVARALPLALPWLAEETPLAGKRDAGQRRASLCQPSWLTGGGTCGGRSNNAISAVGYRALDDTDNLDKRITDQVPPPPLAPRTPRPAPRSRA